MLQATNFGSLLVAVWGMIGIWTTKVGYHNVWEFWFFNAQFGFTMGAQFSYGQAFMAELVPRGREYMFFSLLGIVSKGSGKSAGTLKSAGCGLDAHPTISPPPPQSDHH
jgi:MFS-type transporter involved in bile tolerance (Atg22 family)